MRRKQRKDIKKTSDGNEKKKESISRRKWKTMTKKTTGRNKDTKTTKMNKIQGKSGKELQRKQGGKKETKK